MKTPKRKRSLKRKKKPPKVPPIDFSKCGRCGTPLHGTITFKNNTVLCKPCDRFLERFRFQSRG